jgi:hypothetical protein
MDDTPDSALFLQIDAHGPATVWVALQDLVSQDPMICYRPDRRLEDSIAITFDVPLIVGQSLEVRSRR